MVDKLVFFIKYLAFSYHKRDLSLLDSSSRTMRYEDEGVLKQGILLFLDEKVLR